MAVDDRLQELLERLGRTLSEALSESDDAAQVVETVHRAGLSLFLRLEPRRNKDGSCAIRLVPASEPRRRAASSTSEAKRDPTGGLRPDRIPLPQRATYRLEQADVEYLRELGIDPSRTGRSKASRERTNRDQS